MSLSNNKPQSILEVLSDKELEIRLNREIYIQNYYEFFIDAYRALKPNEPFSLNWHHLFICNALQNIQYRISNRIKKKRDTIINIPFRSSKSLLATVIWPVWCWVVDNSLSFITSSYSASLALEHSQLSKDLIRTKWFQDHFPEFIKFVEGSDRKEYYSIEGGGYRKVVGTGGQITGSGASILVLDDPQDPGLAASEVERNNTIFFYTNTLYSRLNQPELGHRLIIQQRLHEQDLTGYLLENFPDAYDHICIPARLSEFVSPPKLAAFYQNELFWPERFPELVLKDFEKILGSQGAAAQLSQSPAPAEGNLFKKDWFEIIPANLLQRDFEKEPINFYIDTAETAKQKKQGDNTAIIASFKRDNVIYIVNRIILKEEFSELVKLIPDIVLKNGYTRRSLIKVEPKSSGKSIVSQLKATTGLNIMELPSPKDDKITRASAITPICESRRVKFLEGNFNQPLLDSLGVFPNGRNDDDVDAFVHCIEDQLGGGWDFISL